MKTQTVQELRDFLDGLCQMGKGDLPIYFDSEAKKYDYHMVKVGSAYYDEEYCQNLHLGFISLHESRE